jgi:DNA adenine methylase
MQTLIKWPGGKTSEFNLVKGLIPSFDRYIEPFFGGGAVLFQLKPKKSMINDICEELMDFYRYIKGEYNQHEFKDELYDYVNNWEKIPNYLSLLEARLIKLYEEYKSGKKGVEELKEIVSRMLIRDEARFNGLFRKSFCLDEKNLLNKIDSNIVSKIVRTKEIESQRGKLPEGDLQKNIETAFRSGFYMHFRDVMNFNGKKFKVSTPKKIANYYFIREFCYGSMFRFNSDGHFNIPYGGIAYNSKDFRKKVDYIFSDEIKALFKSTVITSEDFECVLKQSRASKDDFIFLDPPYDTEFSDYEKNAFNKNDQERLAECLCRTRAKFMLIIKKTPFIYGLYKGNKQMTIKKFDKTYLYNVKGRNDRDVEHLIITNYN